MEVLTVKSKSIISWEDTQYNLEGTRYAGPSYGVWWGAKESEWGLESGVEAQGLWMYCTCMSRRNQ